MSDLVIARVIDPEGFPLARRAAYVPESEMLVLEWDLPTMSVVPDIKGSTYVQRSPIALGVVLAVSRAAPTGWTGLT